MPLPTSTPGFRMTMFFVYQAARLSGWSESLWNSTAFDPSVKGICDPIMLARQNMLSQPVYCPYYRISDVSNFRNVLLVNTGVNQNYWQTGVPSDIPNSKLLVKMSANPNYITRQWIGGIPDATTIAGVYVPGGAFTGQLNTYIALLKGQGWSICKLVSPQTYVQITGITNAGVVSVAGTPFVNGDSIRIKGVKGMLQANGLWKITAVSAGQFTLVGWIPYPVAPPFYGNTPTASKQVSGLYNITKVEPDRCSTHKAGRPFAQATGRRRRRISRLDLALAGG